MSVEILRIEGTTIYSAPAALCAAMHSSHQARAFEKSPLNLSDEEVRYIDDGIKPGDGLLVAGGARMPITNELPKGRIYDLLTTKPSEVNALGGGGRSAR